MEVMFIVVDISSPLIKNTALGESYESRFRVIYYFCILLCCIVYSCVCNRIIFVPDKSRPKKLHSRKEPLKSSKIPKFG